MDQVIQHKMHVSMFFFNQATFYLYVRLYKFYIHSCGSLKGKSIKMSLAQFASSDYYTALTELVCVFIFATLKMVNIF